MPKVDQRLRTLLFLFYVWVLLRNTWLCEDSYITFRVVDNFVHGLGLRWNPLERVQVYTHPLWMLCLIPPYFLTRDIYFSAVALSLGCSALAVWLILFRGIKPLIPALLAGVILTFSKAFVDFSTSGLENPLSNLLLVLFFIEHLKEEDERDFRKMVLYAGLGMTNRMDLMWFFLPALADIAYRQRLFRPQHLRVWAGLLPFVAWEVFSVVYYGFPFPNSAYAKLTTDVRGIALFSQGVYYLINSLSWDPLTLFVTGVMVVYGVSRAKEDRALGALTAGVLLYVVYGLRVGGDYMTGRLLAAPFVVSLLTLSRIELTDRLEIGIATAAVMALGWAAPRPPVMTNDQYVSLGSAVQSVDDERGYRHNDTSLLKLNKDHSVKNLGGWVADAHKARESGVKVAVYKNIGYYGFFAGPGLHVIDPYGLGDALMSRMPFTEGMGFWASGHFYRKVPEGYADAAVGQGQIRDPEIAAYWKKLELVTRGPLFDGARLAELVRFNLGKNPAPRPH